MTTYSVLLASAVAVASFAACSSGSSGSFGNLALDAGAPGSENEGNTDDQETDAGSARDSGKKPSGGNSTNGELAIVSLTPTVKTVTGGEPLTSESKSVTFIAIVTDKAGLDVIAGGQLMDDTGATYAAFGAGANKGTYSATIDWAQMSSVRAAEFDANGGSRVFVAKFFDNNGNEATAEVEIELACRRAKKLVDACGGECTDVGTDANHCGGCGKACPSNSCVAGKCSNITFAVDPATPNYVQTGCVPPAGFVTGTTCNALCAAANQGPCTRIMVFNSTDATCGGTSVDETCTQDLSKASGPLRCRCQLK